jgi:hypothetical protein
MSKHVDELDTVIAAMLRRRAEVTDFQPLVVPGIARARRRQIRNVAVLMLGATVVAWTAISMVGTYERAPRPRPVGTPPALSARVAKIPIPVNSVSLAAGDGAVWVASPGLRAPGSDEVASAPSRDVPPTLSRMDTATNRVAATVQLGSYETWEDVVTAFGSLWLLDNGGDAVVRLDPVTGAVQARIEHLSGLTHAVEGDGSLWVLANGSILRIDPATNQMANRLNLGDRDAYHLAFGDGRIWIQTSLPGVEADAWYQMTRPPAAIGDNTNGVAVVDAKTLQVVARSPVVGGTIEDVAFAGGAAWAYACAPAGSGDCSSEILRVEPTGEISRTVPVAGAITAIEGNGSDVWVATGPGQFGLAPIDGPARGGRILRIDARTGEVMGTFDVDPDAPIARALEAMAVDGDTLWALSSSNDLLRIELGTT